MNVGLYVALSKDGDWVRYVGKVHRLGRLNALAMRLEEHHAAGEMIHWGGDMWLVPLREDLFEADVLDAEAMLIDILDPPENKTHRRGRGRGGYANRGLDVRARRRGPTVME